MDLPKVLADLRIELENLDAAILSLERLQREGPTRGRPPKLLSGLRKAGLALDTGKRLARRKTAGDKEPS